MITNYGWKAVQIGPSTVASAPQSLTVNVVNVASPLDSFNTLLLNNAGFNVPLTVNSLTVGSNAALTMHFSALRLAGGPGTGMSVGGQINQNDSSHVNGSQADVGWIGPGIYNLNSGVVDLDHLWLGGTFNGVFNQNGGNLDVGIVHLEPGATFNLRGGDFAATVYSADGTLFRQDGGRVNTTLELFRGGYLLNAGANFGGVTIPVAGGGATANGNSWAAQNGGTNFGPVTVGELGTGTFTLSNGVVQSPSIAIRRFGHFHQINGNVTTPAALTLIGGWFDRGGRALAYYTLEGGSLLSPEIYMDTGDFFQTGGTNYIEGDLRLANTTHNFFSLSGGLLTDRNTTVDAAWVGGFSQTGGKHVVANLLSISGNDLFGWNGFMLSGGELIVSNILLNPRAIFSHTGGKLTQSGQLTAAAARMYAAPGTTDFGAFQLAASGSLTNTTFFMPSNACVIRFRDSRAMGWANDAALIIEKWAGSHLGNGAHRITFGSSSNGLTSQQLGQIYFRDPGGGLSPGLHPTRILPNGEIVPNSAPPIGRVPPQLAIRKLPDGKMQLTVVGEAGYSYGIHRSFYLNDWQFWTSGTATNGMFTVIDPETWPTTRYYRAVLMR